MTALATIGHNRDPFTATTQDIQDLYDEMKNWADGENLETKEQHDTLVDLIKKLRKAKTQADEARKEEAKPFDEGKAEVQARYNPFIKPKTGLADMAISTANEILAPYLAKQLRLKKEAEERTRKEAERKEAEACDALANSRGDLEAREAAELLVEDAKKAANIATKVAKTNVAKGARTVWNVEISDIKIAGQLMWKSDPDRFYALILELAKAHVRDGVRDIPGFTITETKVV